MAYRHYALGFWGTLREVYPRTQEQRWWVHKIRNVLDDLPKYLQAKAKDLLHETKQAPEAQSAEKDAMSHLENVMRYYAAWTDVEPEDFIRPGYRAMASPKREQRQDGYATNYLLYGLVHDASIVLSYSSSVAANVLALSKVDRDNLVPALQKQFGQRVQCRRVFYYDSTTIAIDTGPASALTKDHYSDYERFFIEGHPGLTIEGWLKDYFGYLCENGLCFGLYVDGLLVSATDAPSIPYMPDVIAEPGINTLPAYRCQGYARTVCAAFIKVQLLAGKTTIWTCRQENAASIGLARSLGFISFAELYTVEGDLHS